MKFFLKNIFATIALMAFLMHQAFAQFGPPGRIDSNASPDRVLRDFIAQVQTGSPDASFIGPQLWQLIAVQTNNSGVYPILVQKGGVQRVEVIAQRDLPEGPLYSMKVTHSNGESFWLLGVSRISRKIEYASFSVTPSTAPILPPVPDSTRPPSTSEACQKFPNLCPA